MEVHPDHLNVLPRLGWVQDPTPVTALPELAEELGLGWLGVKRDDLCNELHGGTKVRKLDFALATPRLVDSEAWVSVGAIGSGHLATLTAAARKLDRRLLALTFWEPLGPWVEENLAFVASGPTELRFHSSRTTLALRHPSALVGERLGAVPVIAPGASCMAGIAGMVRAGLELAEQIREGVLPEVDRIYLPLGSGGAVVGLSLGLALGGVSPRLHAIAAVEWVFAQLPRLESMGERALRHLRQNGVSLPEHVRPLEIEIDRRRLGRGYGHATEASLRERGALHSIGVGLEPIYGGKAMAALRADAAGAGGERVLFWHTAHRGELPHVDEWRDRLPIELQRKLLLAKTGKLDRRRFVMLGAAVAGVAITVRAGFHAPVAGWRGRVLFEWEGAVLAAAAEALLPNVPGGPIDGGVSPDEIAVNVDRYLVGMPQKTRTEVHGLFMLIEHGTGLHLNLRRFTRLEPAARLAFIRSLAELPDELGQAAKGLRDFTYLGYYQDARAWPSLGYRGPWVHERPSGGRYDSLIAPAGAQPGGRTS